jgi:pimeloyl-ACP methyl ester carboxylesterase
VTFFPEVRTLEAPSERGPVTYYDAPNPGVRPGALVMLHGTAGSAVGAFRALFPILAMRERVIALEFRDPDSDPEFDEYVAQAVAVLEHARVGAPVTLVGYSFGAVVAIAVAARRPDLLDKLILVAGWAKTDQQQRLRSDIWFALHDSDHPALAPFMALTAYSPAYLSARTPAELTAIVAGLAAGPDRTAKMSVNRGIDVLDELQRIDADTLVVGCTDDQMVPRYHSHALFGGIPRARYAEIPAGHAVVHERPAQLARLIQEFIDDPAGTPIGSVLEVGHG